MINEILERFQHIDTLIQEHKTGTPAELAQTVGVSERTIYNYIKLMKKFGAPIAYNIFTKSYYYTEEGSFVCAFSNGSCNDRGEEPVSEKLNLKVTSIAGYMEIMNATLGLANNN